MKSLIVSLIVAFALSLPGFGEETQSPPPQARRVDFQEGRSLIAELRREERTLVVVSGRFPPLQIAPPEGMVWDEWRTRLADFVALIRVNDRRAQLTSAGDWITTTVDATVLDALKPHPDAGVANGATITFVEDGGVLEVDTRRIMAVVPWAQPLKRNATYLVFGGSTDGNINVHPMGTFEVVKSRLRPQTTESADPVSLLDAEFLFRRVRQHAKLGKPWPK